MEDDVLTEPACLPSGTCNTDQLAFRAILARALAQFQGLVSGESSDSLNVDNILAASAEAAGATCSGGSNDTTCGSDWTANEYDGSMGLSNDLSALNIMLANLPQGFSSRNPNSSSNSTSNSTSSGGGSQTSTGGASATSSSSIASASVEMQDQNIGEARSASMVGLLGALGFAIAFFL